MSEYNIEFSESMSKAGKLILDSSSIAEEAQRASLYTSLVSIEISLKYLLDKAGISVPKTHDLKKLMELVCKCTVEDEIAMGISKSVPASRLRSVSVDSRYANATLGTLLEAEEVGASKFPNEIRYGTVLKHYPAETMQKASEVMLTWVRNYEFSIKA
ncbi:HEPN domain-containing protein [Teredinibacter turnerae]|uniref:HEPN domain-containing protein n=1 Tax=Teredinibacter turnerae TaxID=2426 RepID=UPI000362BB61|nr:HEPN domain-containing protein [Teredinibacter turnerae]